MNNLVHWELMVSEPERAQRFYGRVFGWTFEPMGPEYTMVKTGAVPFGGMMKKPPGAPGCVLNSYFAVDDVERTLHDVVEAGGTVVVPKTEIPGIGWFAMFLDPDRIPLGVMQELRNAR